MEGKQIHPWMNARDVAVGETIHGRCTSQGSSHRGLVREVHHFAGEHEPRFLIWCDDGRERIVHFLRQDIHARA